MHTRAQSSTTIQVQSCKSFKINSAIFFKCKFNLISFWWVITLHWDIHYRCFFDLCAIRSIGLSRSNPYSFPNPKHPIVHPKSPTHWYALVPNTNGSGTEPAEQPIKLKFPSMATDSTW